MHNFYLLSEKTKTAIKSLLMLSKISLATFRKRIAKSVFISYESSK